MKNRQKRFENLVHAYSGWLYRYAYWLAGERHLADDLVQETFLRAWRFLDSLKDESSAKAWLTTILRRENARRFERKQLPMTDVDTDGVPAGPAGFDDRAEASALRQALKSLPEKYLEPLLLQVLEGYTLEELADLLDLPRNTVATRLHRARQKLKATLEGETNLRSIN